VSGGALIVVLILSALVVGAAFVLGTPLLAIPIILLLPGPFVTLEMLRRQSSRRKVAVFRRSAVPTSARFDAQDRETLSR
jgi:ABC-type uncharacterized transport system YnjBCD ATPase subunit